MFKPFRSGHGIAMGIMVLFSIGILLGVVSVFSNLAQLNLLSQAASGIRISVADASANDARQQAIGVLQLLVSIVASILFLIWIYRANENLRPLGANNLEFTPG